MCVPLIYKSYIIYYSAHIQFCQVFFLHFFNFLVDKIEIGVYNVIRYPQGPLTCIHYLLLQLPPRVFLGILSEYLSHKYGPELVNKDFGDFLVTVYKNSIGRGGGTCIPILHKEKPKKILVFTHATLGCTLRYS